MEQQGYEVPGQQLRWRVAQLRAQGIPFEVEELGGGVYLIIVQQPAGADPFAYQTHARRRTAAGMPPQVRFAAYVVVAGAIGYIAYAVMGGASILPQDADPDMRQLFARTMDAIGGVLLLALALAIAWVARPLLGNLRALAGSAAAALGKLRR